MTCSAPVPTPPDAQGAAARRVLAAGSFGHFIEAYDFAIYGLMITLLTQAFFSSGSDTAGLLQSLAVFGVAFVARPLGSVFFGWYGDRAGRRAAITASILALGGATLLVGVLPTTAQIGLLAPILLVVLRLVQGLPFGGEMGVAPVFISEHAPAVRRGLWGSAVQTVGQLGFLAASLVMLVVTTSLSPHALASWGWRIPFIIAGPLALVGLYLRLRTEESELFKSLTIEGRDRRTATPVREVFRRNWRQLLQLIGLLSLGAPYYLIITYLPVYVGAHTTLPASRMALVSMIIIAMLAVLIPPAAALGDRYGRKPMLIVSGVATLVLVTPAFVIVASGGFGMALLGGILLALPLPPYYGALSAAQNELFATDVRATGAGIGYNIGIVLFAGLPPFLAAFLVGVTGSNLAPGFMVMGMVVFGICAALTYPRRHGVELSAIDGLELGTVGDSSRSHAAEGSSV